MNIVTDSCPWCGSIISRDKFNEIQAKIRIEEQKKLEAAEAALRRRLETEKQAAEKRIRDEADKKVTALSAELRQALESLKKAEASKAEAYRQAQKEAERKAKEAHDQEVKNLRLIIERDRDQKLLKQQEEFQRRLEVSQKKVDELSKQLQQKSAQDIEGSTIDVFEELQTAFPEDRVTRLHEGKPNEKILHEILYKEISCGRIVLDSRNRQAWQAGFVSKLRVEQVELVAEHAILATTVFPKGKKELCIEDNVIVVNPGGVVHIVSLLREAMMKMHVQGLSVVDRASKVNLLYEFISSQAYAQKCNEVTLISDEILKLEVEEVNQHKKVWEKRGSLVKRLQSAQRDIETNISAILEEGAGGRAGTPAVKSQGHLRRIQ